MKQARRYYEYCSSNPLPCGRPHAPIRPQSLWVSTSSTRIVLTPILIQLRGSRTRRRLQRVRNDDSPHPFSSLEIYLVPIRDAGWGSSSATISTEIQSTLCVWHYLGFLWYSLLTLNKSTGHNMVRHGSIRTQALPARQGTSPGSGLEKEQASLVPWYGNIGKRRSKESDSCRVSCAHKQLAGRKRSGALPLIPLFGSTNLRVTVIRTSA